LSRSPGTHQEEGTIPQALLPLIPDGATRINNLISVVRENGQWIYFCGAQPLLQHPENDRRSFRMFTAQLICLGTCRQVEIVRAFGVSKNSVIRSVNRYRADGVKAFYAPRAARGASVMTPEVTLQAQQLLGALWSRKEVAEQLGLKLDTLRKAIQYGRLTEPDPLEPRESASAKAPTPKPPTATDKSTRAVVDATAVMGTACTRPDERVLAAFGFLNGASTRFETCRDVSFGGALCALPALAENGLFRHIDACLRQLRGYYSTLHVLVLLATWRSVASRPSSSCSTNPRASSASCWDWTVFLKSVVCGTSWPP
jgi:transposase